MWNAHLPKLRKSVLEEGGGALCVEGNIPDAVGALGPRKSPKRSGVVRLGLSGLDDNVKGSNGSAENRKEKKKQTHISVLLETLREGKSSQQRKSFQAGNKHMRRYHIKHIMIFFFLSQLCSLLSSSPT